MKPRRVVLTIEVVTDLPIKSLNKTLTQNAFTSFEFTPICEDYFQVQQVQANVVKK